MGNTVLCTLYTVLPPCILYCIVYSIVQCIQYRGCSPSKDGSLAQADGIATTACHWPSAFFEERNSLSLV